MNSAQIFSGPMARFSWWAWWQERKERYLRSEEPFLEDDRFRSICVGNGLPDIAQHSNFAFRNVKDGADRFIGKSRHGEKPYARIYTRLGNPTTEYLEKLLFRLDCQHLIDAALEEGEKRPTIGSLVVGSGMGAISVALLSLLRFGDGIILGNVYGCTDSLVRAISQRFLIDAFFVDTTDTDAVRDCLERNRHISVVFLESPENPSLGMADIRAISQLTDRFGPALVVDNTFCSAYLQQPFRLGADFVVQSLTKYVNGHSTSMADTSSGPSLS
ncbi:MAG TPA: PLP-dependent transferase [Thermoanaerobaculia bacterium]|nr:PLP-dependent transferase [Thermoanaerobaculia bacterium]